jgi:chaperone modulatory protein CbpM
MTASPDTPTAPSATSLLTAIVVDDESSPLTLAELCHACRVSHQDVEAWVAENVVEPTGAGPHEWTFGGHSLRRALVAARLARDLQVACADLGLVLDLLDEISRLQALLKQRGMG